MSDTKITVRKIHDDHADTSYLEQEGWEDRLEAYNNDQFGFLGIRAETEVVVNGITQQLSSAGLWGIESDSGQAYFDSIAEEEVGELVAVLKELGITVPEPVEWEWHD